MAALGQVRRILFVRTDRLGETLLNLPAVAALRAALPDASVTLLVHPDLHPLLDGLPGVERVLADAAPEPVAWWVSAWRLGRRLRAGRFDLAIVSNPKKELHLAVWLAGIRIRVGYDRKWGWLLSHRIPDRKALGERHEVEYNLDLLRVLGLPTQAPAWSFPQFSREQADVRALLARQGLQPSEPFIVVHPWSSNPAKEWPDERYRALIHRLAEELRIRVVVVGGAQAQDRVQAVLPARGRAVEVVGQLTLRQLAALLQDARLLISNDSGPVHLAAAVGIRTVVLFGGMSEATGPRRWGPWGAGHTVIHRPLTEISVEEVLESVYMSLREMY